jgi:hypothetical protein
MEHQGHVITGMTNEIVWGTPHVFAIFLIVAASGVLNVASVGTVFGQAAYKPSARLSGLLCVALLTGGLLVLMLDLGRPERFVVAATHYNFTSMFAWNVSCTRHAAGGAVPVDADGAAHVPVFPARVPRSSGASCHHRYRFDLRVLVARQAYASAVLAPCSSRCRWPGARPCSCWRRRTERLARIAPAPGFSAAWRN